MMNEINKSREKILTAAQMAVTSDINLMSCDRIEALAGGHGMLNMAIHSVCNVIAEEMMHGGDLSVKFANVRRLPMEDIMQKAIDAAKDAGCDPANAALITASIMYLCGSAAQVGIPAGNRKLGATARMLAGAARCGIAALPTPKMNSKISGFAAVSAIYRALEEGTLCQVRGYDIPVGVGGAIYGHSALGEDYVWPQLSVNGARIGTQAMLNSMSGAGLVPNPFIAAVIGAAAILEIIHPDAEVPEAEGTYGRTTSAYMVGKSAAETAGLPKKLHVNVTGEEYDTAQLIGDVGLILKDIGGVSVIGMMAFDEIFACFRENIIGASGRPSNVPLGHIGGYCVVVLKALLEEGSNSDEIGRKVVENRMDNSMDGETALLSINTVARKSQELKNGPVTQCLIKATDRVRIRAIYSRAQYAYEEFLKGASVEEVVHSLDEQRLATLEAGCKRYFSRAMNHDIAVKIRRIDKAARRTQKVVKKYMSFDPLIDLDLTIDGKTYSIDGFCHDFLPRIAMGEFQELKPYVMPAAAVVSDIAVAANIIINVLVPAAVAAAMGIVSPEEAAKQAEAGAYITLGIPGGKMNALEAAQIAKGYIDSLEE
ncbi:MAG: hypothetical protein ACI4D3_01480 [Lachnospiraceae bacterium]